MNNQAIIVIGHGSRSADATAQFHQVAAQLAALRPDALVLPAFMELASPRLQEAIRQAVAVGKTDIVVVPCFLFQGIHIKEDIPEMLVELRLAHPQLTVRFGRPIGADPRLAEILAERVTEVVCPV